MNQVTKNHEWQIRQATKQDLPWILVLYQSARKFMKENGNPNQWGDEYPAEAQVEDDILHGKSFVLQLGEDLLGVFYFSPREVDPTYGSLLEGKWLDEEPYGVIHRLAVHTQGKGAAAYCVDWCMEQCANLRIDTHEENRPMRRFLEKKGFVFCGILQLPDGSLRMGFQKRIQEVRNDHGKSE